MTIFPAKHAAPTHLLKCYDTDLSCNTQYIVGLDFEFLYHQHPAMC